MNVFYLFSFLFIFFHFFLFFLSFFFFFWSCCFDLVLLSFSSFDFSLSFVFDLYSSSFSSIVFLVSGVVVFYSYYYMSGDLSIYRYFSFLLVFVFSMLLLVYSGNLITSLLGWDGLGLSSFCLIVYYNGFSSLRSGIVSIYVNRLGDSGLMICVYFLFLGGWIGFINFNVDFYFLLVLIISCMTSSAQIPFSSWLPAAMSAPTPISSLVHSSTLVTAGIYLMVRFDMLFVFDVWVFSFFFISTMILAGFVALVEQDAKKVIAMSTLSQLGMMFFFLSYGEKSLCFFHMLTHALFKSLLFLSCGGLMYMVSGDQDLRFKGRSVFLSPFFSIGFSLSSMSLSGFPFFSGFFSSDLCLDSSFEMDFGFFSFFFFLFGCFMTVLYSMRLFVLGISSSSSFFSLSNGFFCFPLVFLMIMSVLGGYFFSFIFSVDDLFFSFSLVKLVGLLLIIFSIFFFSFFVFLFSSFFSDFFLYIFSLDYLFGFKFSSFFYNFSFLSLVDMTWNELFDSFFLGDFISSFSYGIRFYDFYVIMKSVLFLFVYFVFFLFLYFF